MANKNRATLSQAQAAAQRAAMPQVPTTPEQPEEPDLLGTLLTAFKASPQNEYDEGMDADAGATRFVAFARDWLRNNMPVGFDFSGAAPSMRFQDGEILPVVSFPPGEAPGMDGVASGTAINAHARKDGRGDTVATPAWGVTGNDGKK